MNLYLQCLPGEIVIRESSPEPDDTGTDRVVAAVTAAELLEIVADYRRRKQSEAESRAAFAAEMDRRLALVEDYDRRRELANRPVGGNK